MAIFSSDRFKRIHEMFYTRRDIPTKGIIQTNSILRCNYCNKFFTYVMMCKTAPYVCPHCGKN